MAKKLTCISGAYRKCGTIEQSIAIILQAAEAEGWECEHIRLIEKDIAFCTNCRQCMQESGDERGKCIHDDDMAEILDTLETSDALVLASPVNFFNATAVTRRFLERMACYGYWPWEQNGPVWRGKKTTRKAVLITSSAMPGIAARFFTKSIYALKNMARCLQAKPVACLYLGLRAQAPDMPLTPKIVSRLERSAQRLLR